MATLEVHDAQGQVQYVELSREHPVTFGTSAACDIVLDGDGVRPVHGRIRWSGPRYKVEASPDALYVLINGTKMTTGSLHQGDEIAVGKSRIFMLRGDDDADPNYQSGSRWSESPTTSIPPSFGHREPATLGPESISRGRKREKRDHRRGSALEHDDWLESLGLKDNRGPSPGVAGSAFGAARGGAKPASSRIGRWVGLVIERLRPAAGPAAPGRENLINSPLVIGLVVSLGVLIGMGFWLKAIIAATIATKHYNNAVQNFEDGDFRTCLRNFDTFLAENPEDPRTGKARVLRAFANVRQYVSSTGATWTSALEAAREMVQTVSNEEAFRDEKMDLAELVLKIGEGLADRARQSADPKALTEAESSVPLHAQVAGENAPSFLNRSRLPTRLKEARAAVLKARIRAESLAAMDRALALALPKPVPEKPAGDGPKPATAPAASAPKIDPAALVYDERDKLVDRYPDLARDPALIERMTAANDLIRKAVVVRTTKRPAAVAPRPDPLGPATSLVLRSADSPATHTPAPESIVFALADGFLYALDGTNGAPIWHTSVGLSSPFVPRLIAGDNSLLAVDARYNELLRLDSTNGSLRWRLELSEPVLDPPLILGNQVIQVVPGGRILIIDLETGELSQTIDIGRPLARTPVADDAGRLYVMGRSDCVFVLERDPLQCVLVDYLGHADGAIPCAPGRLGPYLVIPENDRLDHSLWHILVIESEGKHIRPAQEVEVAGWTWQTPASSGAIIWAIGDKGGYEAFAIGEEKSKVPFRSIARQTADATESGPAFALARSERELWVASGHSAKLALDPERAAIETKLNIGQPGPALAAPQLVGTRVVLSFQDRQTDGVALWAYDAVSGRLEWKTILGAAWQPPLCSTPEGAGLNTLRRDGRPIALDAAGIASGGFVAETLTTPGQFALPAGDRIEVTLGGKPTSVIVPPNHSRVLWVQDGGSADGWRKVELSSPLAANPVAIGEGLLIPGLDARAYVIDPLTARSLAEPFVRPFDRERQGIWYAPASLDLDTVVLADDMGRLNRLALEKTPVARLAGTAEAMLDQKIIAPPGVTGGAVIVVTADRKIRALAARDLSPLGSWPMDAPLAGPIQEIPNGCLVYDRAGGVVLFGRDGARRWSVNLGSQAVGAPLVRDQTISLLSADGTFHVRALSDGAERERRPLDVAPVAGPLAAPKENGIAIAVGRGSIRLLLPSIGGKTP